MNERDPRSVRAGESTHVLQLDERAIDLFASFSHDLNPLHVDPLYARRTSFGGVVVHGMLLTLANVLMLTRGRRAALYELKATFRGAVFPDVVYRCDSGPLTAPGGIRTAVRRGAVTKAVLEAYTAPPKAVTAAWLDTTAVELLTDQRTGTPGRLAKGDYWGDDSALDSLLSLLGVPEIGLPRLQMHLLGLLSYVAGMVMPGRQGLLLGARAQLLPESHGPHGGRIGYRAELTRHDTRFGRSWVRIGAACDATPVLEAEIEALVRPDPPTFRYSKVQVPSSPALRDLRVIVTGGTRGLGAQLTAELAARGADVTAGFHRGVAEAEHLRAELADVPGRVALRAGDLRRPEVAETLAGDFREAGGVDVLILNATGPIRRTEFRESTQSELERELVDALSMVTAPLRALLPLLEESQGVVVLVSSIYADQAPAGFGGYVAAKRALEGLLRVVSGEHRGVRYCIVRPPRMNTDQTAANFSVEPVEDPVIVARWTVRCLEEMLSCDPGIVREFVFERDR